jgi:hypothetical protein
VGQAFTQVKTYFSDKGINLTGVAALIIILETAFGDPNLVATAERKLEVLKQMNGDFSTYYVKLQCYATNVQCNDPAKCTALMWRLNNEIKDALTLSDNVPQQFLEFVAFLPQLNN